MIFNRFFMFSQIIFFERNGLRHGEFLLPNTADLMVEEVCWNNDSTVLAVWLKSLSETAKIVHKLQLWTTRNYTWYLKQVGYFIILYLFNSFFY